MRIESFPNERAGIFHVSVQCLGKLPPRPMSAMDVVETVLKEVDEWMAQQKKRKKKA